MTRRSLLLALPLGVALTLPAAAAEVLVFAAASMKTALDPIAAEFQAATGQTVTVSYAGSNTLAKQIIEGAPADIFISASTQWMDAVEAAGEVADGTRADLLAQIGDRTPLDSDQINVRTLFEEFVDSRTAASAYDPPFATAFREKGLAALGSAMERVNQELAEGER